jgi:purine-nucleoside phosphorylase
MSTVPEVVTAVHCGFSVLGISLITNKVHTHPSSAFAVDIGAARDATASHEEVLETSRQKAVIFVDFLTNIVKMIGSSGIAAAQK